MVATLTSIYPLLFMYFKLKSFIVASTNSIMGTLIHQFILVYKQKQSLRWLNRVGFAYILGELHDSMSWWDKKPFVKWKKYILLAFYFSADWKTTFTFKKPLLWISSSICSSFVRIFCSPNIRIYIIKSIYWSTIHIYFYMSTFKEFTPVNLHPSIQMLMGKLLRNSTPSSKSRFALRSWCFPWTRLSWNFEIFFFENPHLCTQLNRNHQRTRCIR